MIHNFIYNYGIIEIFSIIAIIIFLFFIIRLIMKVSNYFESLTAHQLLISSTYKVEDDSSLSLPDRTESTVELLAFCNSIIDNEIAKNLSGYARLNKKYDMTKFDSDYMSIADSVYKSLKPDLLDSDDLIIPSEFVMHHILDETMVRLMRTTEEYNNNLKK